jgi:uncharacterized membrane protein YgdD (TMEM256/DUF423 family)
MALAAVSGLMAVMMGAFAAHLTIDPTSKRWLDTGSHYQLMHALAALACATFLQAGARGARFAPALFLAGTVLFSGSLYAMALGGPLGLGAVTPAGGLLFIAGWAVLVWSAKDIDRAAA